MEKRSRKILTCRDGTPDVGSGTNSLRTYWIGFRLLSDAKNASIGAKAKRTKESDTVSDSLKRKIRASYTKANRTTIAAEERRNEREGKRTHVCLERVTI